MKRPLGKGEVESSILSCSTSKPLDMFDIALGVTPGDQAELRVNEPRTAARNCPTIWRDLYPEIEDMPGDAWPRFDDPTSLYRYFHDDGTLLYVGMSNQFTLRDRAHHKSSHWRCVASWVRLEVFPNRDIAEIAESWAIEEERPMWNVKAQSPRYPARARHGWYLDRMGGLIGELPRWAAVQQEINSGVTRCDPPDWWDDAKLYRLSYSPPRERRNTPR